MFGKFFVGGFCLLLASFTSFSAQPTYTTPGYATQQRANVASNVGYAQQAPVQQHYGNNVSKGVSQLDTADDEDDATSNNIFLNSSDTVSNFDIASIPVFVQSGSSQLSEVSLNNLMGNKTIVVFFGKWCPYCSRFLTSFSQYVDILRLSGINILFVHIPENSKLKTLGVSKPDIDEFNEAENKISSLGIKLSNRSVSVALLAKKSSLIKLKIDGLPVVAAVKNGKEVFRGVGESGVSNLTRLSDQNVLRQLLEIWSDDSKKVNKNVEEDFDKIEVSSGDSFADEGSNKVHHKLKKHKHNRNHNKLKKNKINGTKTWIAQLYGVDLRKAHRATESLNKVFNHKREKPRGKCFFSNWTSR